MSNKKLKKIKEKEFFNRVLKELELHKKVYLRFIPN